ncbi:MAG: hypothetical protein N2170_06905 [Bacteroidia bacterium]|nr:hypothetical protein [Bacteroidia bacterium]
MKLLLSTFTGAILLAQPLFLPDSVPLGKSFWTGKVSATDIPVGPECLARLISGDTQWVRLRFWEGPGEVQWKWGQDTLHTTVFVGALPPDSLMPLGDFAVPLFSDEELPDSPSLWWIWALFVLLLVLLTLGTFFRHKLRKGWERLYLPLRWYYFLWRWRPHGKGSFLAFSQACKDLLRPHADFHPGSLTLPEVEALKTFPPLREALHLLLATESQLLFLKGSVPPSQVVSTWREVWIRLRALAPILWRRSLLLEQV